MLHPAIPIPAPIRKDKKADSRKSLLFLCITFMILLWQKVHSTE